MKVTFINPYYQQYEGPISDNFLPPLDLVNCATLLKKKGFSVKIMDANILRMDPPSAVNSLEESDIFVVATSPRNTWQCPPLEVSPYYAVVQDIRARFPKAFIITHGPNSLFNPETLAAVSDIVIIGQPDPFFDLLDAQMKTDDYFDLPGIAYTRDGKFVQKERFRWFNLTKLPQPDFTLIPYTKYRFPVLDGPMIMLETSRGCPERCSFCFQGMTNYSFSAKKVDEIITEIRYVREQLGIKSIFFTDLEISVAAENFKNWMAEVVRQKIDVKWACQIRMSVLEDDDLVQLMADSGCKVVMVGLESGTEAAFEDLPKNRDEHYVYNRVRRLQKAGIQVLGYFILGSLYEETEEDIDKTVAYAKWLDVDYATFQVAIPYPTTVFHEKVKHLAKESSPENIPLAYQKNFDLKRLRRLKKKAYMGFYLRPGYVLNHLDFFLNPRDLLRNLKVFYDVVKPKTSIKK